MQNRLLKPQYLVAYGEVPKCRELGIRKFVASETAMPINSSFARISMNVATWVILIFAILVLMVELIEGGNWSLLGQKLAPETKDVVDAQCDYLTYLATLTSAVVAGLLALLEFGAAGEDWRPSALFSLFFLLTALALITCGYAVRIVWITKGGELGMTAQIVDGINGPLTAIVYLISLFGLFSLARIRLHGYLNRA
ncbi:MAG: hypothetical protein QM775_28920 [Pirellulales bacterium]